MSHREAVKKALYRASVRWKDENATRLVFMYDPAVELEAKIRLAAWTQ